MRQGQTGPDRAGQEWIRNGMLATGSLILALLVAEGMYRLVRPQQELVHQPLIYRPDETIGYRYIPGSADYMERIEFHTTVQINSAGFRDDEFSVKRTPGSTRIAVVGDSFSVGLQVPMEETFPEVLETTLNEAGIEGCPCEVYNFAIDGIGTEQQYALLEEVLTYRPDVILLAYYYNDVADTARQTLYRDVYRGYVLFYYTPEERAEMARRVDTSYGPAGQALRFAIRHSYLARAGYSFWASRRSPIHGAVSLTSNRTDAEYRAVFSEEEAAAHVRERITSIRDRCAEAGCELVVGIIPVRDRCAEAGCERVGGVPEKPAYPISVEQLSRQGIRALALEGPLQNALEEGAQVYWQYDAHFTAAGHQIVAAALFDYLIQEGLIGSHR